MNRQRRIIEIKPTRAIRAVQAASLVFAATQMWACGSGDSTNSVLPQNIDNPPEPYTVLAEDANATLGVLDNAFIYWTSRNRVLRVPKEGGESVVLTQVDDILGAIAIDNQYVYFAANRMSMNTPIWRVEKSGGEAVELVVWEPGGIYSRIDVTSSSVYFFDWRAGLLEIPNSGGDVNYLTPSSWLEQPEQGIGHAVVDVAFEGEFAYALDANYGIYSVHKTTGAISLVLSPPNDSSFVGVGIVGADEQRLYYSNDDFGEIRVLPKTGGIPQRLAGNGSLDLVHNFVSDGTTVYWCYNSRFLKHPADAMGGEPTVLLDLGSKGNNSCGEWSRFLLVDESYLYFSVDNRIVRLPK
jgi:hypothetical protein